MYYVIIKKFFSHGQINKAMTCPFTKEKIVFKTLKEAHSFFQEKKTPCGQNDQSYDRLTNQSYEVDGYYCLSFGELGRPEYHIRKQRGQKWKLIKE